MAKEEPQDIFGDLKNMRISPNFISIAGKSDDKNVAWLLSPERLSEVQSGASL